MINGINSQNHLSLSFLRGVETVGGAQADSSGIQPNQPQQFASPGQGNAVNDQLNPVNRDESKISTDNQDNPNRENNLLGNNLQENQLQENPLEENKTADEKVGGESQQENKTGSNDESELSEEEKKEVQDLKDADRKIRAHEMAHLAAAAGISVSGANFSYTRGPDGVNYATGGEVSIDTSKESDPQATIQKAQQVVRAAMAPADPSSQDRSVAAKAQAMEAQARVELAKEQQEKAREAQDTATGEAQQPNSVREPGQTQNNRASETGTATGASQTERPNPGIETYRQNQAFAPSPASDTNRNMIDTAATISGGGLYNFRGFNLDIAA